LLAVHHETVLSLPSGSLGCPTPSKRKRITYSRSADGLDPRCETK
jgi:hypothetical protein